MRYVFMVFLAALLAGCSKGAEPVARVEAVLEREGTIRIAWETDSPAERYQLFRRDGQSEDFHYLCDVTEQEYLDEGTEYGKLYSYKVRAVSNGRASDGVESEPVADGKIPAITGVTMFPDGSFRVEWEDTGTADYCLYGTADGTEWKALVRTESTKYLVEAGAASQVAVSTFFTSGTAVFETPRSEGCALLPASVVTSVTQMDKYTAVVQYVESEGASEYWIYRSATRDGTYRLTGKSRETVYYDEIENGNQYFYKVQPVSGPVRGCLSDAKELGYQAGEVTEVPVFMYHEFVTQQDLSEGVLFDEYAIWAHEFEADLKYLKENGFTTISCRELSDFLKGSGSLPDKPVLLTIDDGKLGVYKNAYPLLKKYGMKASLSVIGERIDAADAAPEKREGDTAPYCTWIEIAEMSDSGTVEIISHTYMRHRYRNNGHRGADIAEGEEESAFFQTAFKDYERMDLKLKEVTGKGTIALSYPYSARSEESDRVWLQCGYEILLAGDGPDARRTRSNLLCAGCGLKQPVFAGPQDRPDDRDVLGDVYERGGVAR